MYHFKNAVFYRFQPDADFSDQVLQEALDGKPFQTRSRHEHKRIGWDSPAPGLIDSRVFTSSGAHAISLHIEEAILPAAAVRKALSEKIAQIESTESRKVFKKELSQLKDEVTFELLPRALSRDKYINALIIPGAELIVIDASSTAQAELLLSKLRDALGSLRVRWPEVNYSPAVQMTAWLLDTASLPDAFCIEHACKLVDSLSGEKATITMRNENLLSQEVRAHLECGMEVSRLALCWEDQLLFTLHDDLSLHGLRLTDTYRDSLEEQAPEEELAALDADVTHLSLEFQRLLPAIADAFGGEQPMLSAA